MNNNYGNPKKVVGMRLYLKAIILGNFLLFNFFIFLLIKFFILNYDRAVKNGTAATATIIIAGVTLFLVFFAYVLPYFLIKKYGKMKYYDDGFVFGKGEKVLYENLDYFFIPNTMKINTFLSIWFKNNEGIWEIIPAAGYPKDGFDEFQQDFVKANYPKTMQKIENGETVEFLFNDPKKLLITFSTGTKKYIEKKLQQALKIKVSKEALVLDDEVYKWDEYKINMMNGIIIIKDKNDNKILTLTTKALIHRENLLEAIVNTLVKCQ